MRKDVEFSTDKVRSIRYIVNIVSKKWEFVHT